METCHKVFGTEVIQATAVQENSLGMEVKINAKVAKAGCRIYGAGVSYAGRTYAEGKKNRWRNGVRASYCILKYNQQR